VAKRRYGGRRKVVQRPRRTRASKKSNQYLREAQQAAERFVKIYEKRHRVRLTYDMNDVGLLDKELEKNYEKNTLTPDETVCMGYYLGELLRRNVGGKYEFRKDYNAVALKCLDIVAFPILKVQKALEDKNPAALESYAYVYAKKVSDKREKGSK